MDAGSGLAILGSTIGGAKIIEKLLGPTAEYLGEGLKSWTSKRVQNVGRIFKNAQTKLGERIDAPQERYKLYGEHADKCVIALTTLV